jgi:D-alanyl-D-alanine carboxypeptidase/D-alanyl-D-alanine-endopeptidase (penicillin-binding protein 4)
VKNLYIMFLGLVFLSSCKTSKIAKTLNEQDAEQFMGVHITDTKTGEILFSHNRHKTFVPASNTKILTLYSCLKVLGDSIPAFKYFNRNDTLFVLGTGDPTLLHPDFSEGGALKVLKKAKAIVISNQNQQQNHYGVGWAWDDYSDYYQPEISAFPIYGNVVRVKKEGAGIKLSPDFFNSQLKDTLINSRNVIRDEWENTFRYNKTATRNANFNQEIPFKTNYDLTATLLSKAIGVAVENRHFEINLPFNVAYSHPVDTVLRKMMQQSDNMLAEQLLLLAGGADTVSTNVSIKHLSNQLLGDVNEPYSWRDGSGLSRYNLFSPVMMVQVLSKMYKEFPQERVFSLMSIGGKAGTLRNKYKSETPYVFAKTGSMSGVYNESGYLITKSGRMLTYSVMKNNFTGTVAENGAKTMEFINKVRSLY